MHSQRYASFNVVNTQNHVKNNKDVKIITNEIIENAKNLIFTYLIFLKRRKIGQKEEKTFKYILRKCYWTK